MAVYAIGDVQGCFDELLTLLDEIEFNRAHDLLWFAGDLINRGPRSLDTLRFVAELGGRAVTVLGNHDLHLLAAAAGARRPHTNDTLDEILDAPDRDQLVSWLRQRPLLHHDAELGFCMVHAGLPPQWDLATAARRASEVEAELRGPGQVEFLNHMYGNKPARWSEDLEGFPRLRFITNALTRIRYCDETGRLRLKEKCAPEDGDRSLIPWFEMPDRQSKGERIIFGHWATLRIDAPPDPTHRVYHLDTGCVWGGQLTALRLEDERYFSVPCNAACERGS